MKQVSLNARRDAKLTSSLLKSLKIKR